MSTLIRTIAAAAAGMAAMYLLDPDSGRRRRAAARERLGAAARGLDGIGRDGSGAGDTVRADRRLRDRVRSRLERLVADPAAVEVVVNGGSVSLRGSVMAAEVDTLLSAVAAMPGVRHVDNRLEANDVPHSTLADLVADPGATSKPAASRPD
jgi:hypothetical protein